MTFSWLRFLFTLVLTVANSGYAYILYLGFGNGVPSGARDGLALLFVWLTEIIWIGFAIVAFRMARQIPALVGLLLMAINASLLVFAFFMFPKTL